MCKANHYQYKQRLGGCRQKSLRKDELDASLLKLAGTVLSDPSHLAEMITASVARQRSVIKPLTGIGSQPSLIADLNRRDARILQAFEAGAITVEELRTRRADIRRQLECLQGEGSKQETAHEQGILHAARLIVKSGLRFQSIKGAREQKLVLAQTFRRIFVRDACVISFDFNIGVLPAGSPLIGHQIQLNQPIRISDPPEQLADGFHRCIKCRQIKQIKQEFYPRRNSCKSCLSEIARHRYAARCEVKSVHTGPHHGPSEG